MANRKAAIVTTGNITIELYEDKLRLPRHFIDLVCADFTMG